MPAVRWVLAVFLVNLAGYVVAPAAAQAAVEGTVFVDENRDGLLSAGEHGAAGVAVFADADHGTLSDANGHFSLPEVPGGQVWARSPDGFQPAPTWAASAPTVELALVPMRAPASSTFVQMADLHVGIDGFDADDAGDTLARATDVLPAPDFLVVTGDMTNGTKDEEFATMDALLRRVDVPFVPVPGNHDWHDGGPRYRARFGPPMYSFDASGAHFVVLNFNDSVEHQLAFVNLDLATGAPGGRVIVFTHAPPPDRLVDGLAAAGVDDIFSGHVHSNHVSDVGGLTEYNTEPPVMGGLDHTPAGYRVVAMSADALTVSHRTTLVDWQLGWVFPEQDFCLDPAHPDVVVVADAPRPMLSLTLDGAPGPPLEAAGGWAYVAHLSGIAEGRHHAHVTLRSGGSSETRAQDIGFRVCTPQAMDARPRRPWLQTQAGPTHTGASDLALAPPLDLIWAVPTGGHLQDGTTLVSEDLVLAGVTDLADGRAGGVIAVEAATGRVRWKHPILGAVRGTLAASDDIVVAGDTSGRVTALHLSDGTPLWQVDLGEGTDAADSWLYSPPTIVDGVVHVGIQPRQAALDLRTGEVLWTADHKPAYGPSHAAAAVAAGVVVMPVGHNHGKLYAFDAATGLELWHQDDPIGKVVEASPVVSDSSVFVINTEGTLYRLDLKSGVVEWQASIYDWHGHWGWGPLGTPAYEGGVLYVPAPRGGLYAVDAAGGEVLWKLAGGASRVRPDPYENTASGFQSAPVVTGNLVWIGGGDGIVRAVDRTSGVEVWSKDVGVPILTSVVTDGQMLVVAGYDGVLRAYAHRTTPRWSVTSGEGCGIAAGAGRRGGIGSNAWMVLLLAMLGVAALRSCSPCRAARRSSAARPRGTRRRPAWRPRASRPAGDTPRPSGAARR